MSKNNMKMIVMKLKLSRHQNDTTMTCNKIILKRYYIDIAFTYEQHQKAFDTYFK